MNKYLLLAGLFLLSSSGWAFELHLNLDKEVQKVLQPKERALDLEDVKKLVVNDSIDVQISYERLVEAQRKIGLARSAYFPYGLGTVAAMYFFNVWNPLMLAELITSLPSKIYHVQAEKNMSMAQQYTLEALKENLKNQVAHLYYSILKEEAALRLTKLNIALMEQMVHVYRERVKLGIVSEVELIELEQNLRKVRDTFLKFSSYMNEARAAFNGMLQLNPGNGLELQPVSDFLSADDFNLTARDMVRMALERSPEIVAADYLVSAAHKARKSTKWSVLSFGGLGFGYFARVQVAGHKVHEARLNRQMVEENLVNQVYAFDDHFKSSLALVQSEQGIFENTDFYMRSQLERFRKGHIPLNELLEAQLIYLKDFNELVQSHYLSLTRLDDIERLILGKARALAPDEIPLEIKLEEQNRRWYALWVETPAHVNVEEVRYIFDDHLSLRPMTSYSTRSDFSVRVKLYQPRTISGVVEVTLSSGEVLTKKFNFVH